MAVKVPKERLTDIQVLLCEVERVKKANAENTSDALFKYKLDGKEFSFASGSDMELVITDIPQAMWRFLEFSNNSPPAICQGWISRTIMAYLFENETLNTDGLVAKLSTIERGYLSKRNCEYLIVSKISINNKSKIKEIKIDDVVFTFSDYIDEKISLNHDRQRKLLNINTDVKDYLWVQARLKAKCPFGAHAYYRKILHRLMGAWGVVSQQSRLVGFPIMEQKLDQLFAVGPVATVHNVDGSLAGSTYWYEIHFDPDKKPIIDDNFISGVVENGIKVLNSIDTIKSKPMKTFAQDVFALYGEAVISYSNSERFMGMWRMLEKASCVSPGESHSKIVDRVSSLFKDNKQFIKTILQYLRISRNVAVHDGDNISTPSSMWYLDSLCKDVMVKILKYCKHFESQKEYVEFLDAPTDIKIIESKRKTLEMAKKYKV